MFRALCHGLNAAKAPQAFSTPLQTRFFIPPFAGGGGIGDKRRRDELAVATTASNKEVEIVHLPDSDDEEKQQRQRIMNFAASRRVENKQQDTTLSKINKINDNDNTGNGGITTATATADETTMTADEEETGRTRIMAQAAAINADRGISSNNNLLAQLHAERQARKGPAGLSAAAPSSSHSTETNSRLTILSYNLWFREDVQVHSRMEAISHIISTAVANDLPDILCFQEMTPFIYHLLSNTSWWRQYTARPEPEEFGRMRYFTVLLWKNNLTGSTAGSKYAFIPFQNSGMGRDLKAVNLTPHNIPICVATSHLESPTGRQRLFSERRQQQCQEALAVLDSMGKDALYIGDMNWNENNDGEVPLPAGW
jgi:tyrosyl-DNA phosphodiesterase 2